MGTIAPILAALVVGLSSGHAGAHGVRLTVTLRYEQQCGYPGSDPVVLTLPRALPGGLVRTRVLVDGKPARSIAVHGSSLTVAMPPRPQILCDSITVGSLRLEVRGLVNPADPGRYRVTARKGRLAFAGFVVIRR
jgi:hypothetical protein